MTNPPLWPLLAVLVCAPAFGDPPSGSYSLDLTEIRESSASDALPPCGDEGNAAITSRSLLQVVFRSGTVVVNGDEWVILRNETGMFAATPLTKCTSLTLRFGSRSTSANGTLLFFSKCPERPACATVADYEGTYTP